MTLKRDMAKALISSQTGGDLRDMTPYAQVYGGATVGMGLPAANPMTAMLPRNADEFLGNFGPSVPATIAPIDAPRTQGMVIPRINQYPVGANLPTPPGATKLIDFRILRQLADVYDILRSCIKVRTQEIASMKWEILPKHPKDRGHEQEIHELTKFFHEPDPIRGWMFDEWIKALLEEIFVTDSLSIYPHPTWLPGRGPLGGDLFALEIIDGTTIKPLVDIRGSRPLPPNPAYQQFLYGVPRTDMATALADYERQAQNDGDGWDSGTRPFSASQLYYKPYHTRAWTMYGFSNVEQIIMNINLALRRQMWHTAYFTDGSIPAGLLHVPEEWNPTQIREYEEGWNSLLGGDTAWKHRVRAVPGATGFSQLKPPVHDMTFDDWIARVTMIGMDVTPAEINFEPRGGLGGSGWSEQQQNILYRKSLKPITQWLERFLNRVIAVWFQTDDVVFRFIYEEIEDALKRAQEDEILIRVGVKVPNEARGERGLNPYPDELGDQPLLITRQGPILLEDINAASKGSVGKNEDGTMMPQPLPPNAVNEEGMPVAPIAQDDIHGPTTEIATPEGPVIQDEGADMEGPILKPAPQLSPSADPNEDPQKDTAIRAVTADLRKYQTKVIRSLKSGRRPTVKFDSDVLPEDVVTAIESGLSSATTDVEVRSLFEKVMTKVREDFDILGVA